MSRYALVVPVGPRDLETSRFHDLMKSLWHHEPLISDVIVMDDGPAERNLLDGLTVPQYVQMHFVKHPRAGKRGWDQMGSLTMGMHAAYEYVAREVRPDWLLKVDTDSLIIGPFAERITRAFAADPQTGIVGMLQHVKHADPTRSSTQWNKTVRGMYWRHLLPFDYYAKRAKGERFVWARNDPDRQRRKGVLLSAKIAEKTSTWRFGDHCQGGGYAISHRCLRAISEAGLLTPPTTWGQTNMSEDVSMSMFAAITGYRLTDHSGPGEPFGVRYIGLPDTLDNLVAAGYGIIHAVKNDPRFSEEDIRAYFRARRDEDVKQREPQLQSRCA